MALTALLVGGAFGVRHAFEADHVAAVATLVEDETSPAATGVAWGVGHSVPLLALGGAFLALDVRPPAAVANAFEALVALVLVALGLRVLLGRESLGTTILRHVGRDGPPDGHGATPDGPHGGAADHDHSHADEASFAVGIVHGLAGSGGVVVALAAAAPTAPDGAAFLVGFSLALIAAMGLAAWGWGHTVVRTDALRTAAGIASVAVGCLLLAEVLGLPLPL